MQVEKKKMNQRQMSNSQRIALASRAIVERIESRVLMSTTVAAWSFDSLTIGTNLSPAPSSGTGTALTVGLQTSSSNANSPGGIYAYPNPNASGTGDTSDILNGTGNNPPATSDNSSTGQTAPGNTTGVNPAWRVRGASDGWSSNAALVSQGAQFTTSTVGDSGISVTFDLDPSSGGAPSEIAVEYTTDGSTWNLVPAADLGTPTSSTGGTGDVSVSTNSSNPNIVNGAYYQIANTADALFWQNGFSVNLSGISAVNNDSNFGIRIVNAATGSAEFEVTGTGGTPVAYPTAGSGNWRLDNIVITASGGTQTPPSISTNPANQTVAAGQSVTFTSAASGNPTPTVQWYEGGTPATGVQSAADTGGGTLLTGDTSPNLTFSTSGTAADNGNTYWAEYHNSSGYVDTTAASLNDALAAPVVTVSPQPVSVTGGNTATFTAAATGSPSPSVAWYYGTSSNPALDTNLISGTPASVYNPSTNTTTATYSFPASTTQNGEYFVAQFTNNYNGGTSVLSSPAQLTVSGTAIAAWNFTSVVAAPDNTPAPTTHLTTASAISIGLTNTYTYAGTTATNSVTNDDITNGVSPEDFWRVRGHYVATGTAPNIGTPSGSGNVNGWNLNAPQYTQGVEFDVSTVGFQTIGVSFDWESTAQGIRDLQEQYNLNTNDPNGWTNINPLLVNNNAAFLPGNTIDLIGISRASNDPNFGIRLVSAYDPTYTGTGAPTYTASTLVGGNPVQYNNSSGNWGFDKVQVTGTQIPAAPAITANGNPADQTVPSGTAATFTAAATGYPTPTVQWYEGTPGSGTALNDTTYPSADTTTLTFTTTPSESGNTYYAVFTNNVSPFTATTTAATLTVTTAPTITTQPLSQTVAAGTTVTFIAAAGGNPTPTEAWEVATPNGTGGYNAFTNITSGSGGYTILPNGNLSFTANEGMTGNEYEAVFTNSSAPSGIDSNPAVLTVMGTPIAQWIFTGGEAPPPGGSTNAGTGNDPYPTFGPISNTASTLGLQNDYTGIEAFPESDILVERSTLNPSFSEYDWRLRSGNGYGPTGSPGTPEGWSQNAPEYSQGVQFDVNTTGYSNITLHFDWNQGGISDMQPLYSTDAGQTWNVLPNGLITQTAPGGDFYGITPTTTPTGVTVNLQGIAGVGNNPNFELRLAAAYDPSLPLITDGNEILNGGNTSIPHGQYATGIAGPVNAQQVIQFGNDENSTSDVSGGTFTLTFEGATTGPIAFSSNNTTLAANITAALNALTVNGTANYLQGNFTVSPTNYSGSTELNPVRDALGDVTNTMTVTFNGKLAATAVPTMTANGSSLTGSNPSLVVQDYVNGSKTGFKPYVDGGGAWQLGNISFNGDATTSGGLGIVVNPVPAVTAAESHPVTLTATAYSETTPVTAQWYVNGSPVPSVGTAGSVTSGTNITPIGNSQYTSTYTFTTDATPDQSGDSYYVVFSAGPSTAQSASSTLTVVPPLAPLVIIPPANTSVQAGNVTTISATATGSPPPTVAWQVSTDGGHTWSPVSNNTTYSGATTVTTTFAGYVATLSIASATSMNGYEYEAIFSNGVTPVATSSPATLTVLTQETVLTDWDFNSTYPTVTSAGNSPDPYVDGPPPVAAGVDGSVDVGGAALPVGMNLPYAYYDSGTGTDGNGAVAEADIVNSPGALNPNFNENTWRVRGGPLSSPTSAGTPANGWSNFVPQYSQGVQFDVPTTGYNDVYVTLDWYSTTSGELDAQEQYTVGGTTVSVTNASSSNTPFATSGNPNPQPGTNNIATLSAPNSFKFGDEVTVTGLPAPYDGTFQIVYATPNSFSYYTPTLGSSWNGTGSAYVPTWTNINNPVQAFSNDFYGATATGGPVPLLIDVSAIPGAAYNPNFGIRLVNAYDPYLSNTQTLELGDTNNFTLTFNGQTTNTIIYSANPAQMAANVQAALAALSTVNGASNVTVTAPQSSSTLTITFDGALDAVAQPAIVANDQSDTIVYTPQYANALLVTGSGPNGTTTQVPAPYNGSKGNWRFDNIVIHGVAITPTVLSISPTSGPVAGGTTVIITGTNFTGATAVDFGTTPATSFTVNAAGTQITAVDPTGSGIVDVTVVTPNGTSAISTADQFTYISVTAPTVTGVVINGDNPNGLYTDPGAANGKQRSMVEDVVYTFNEPVTITNANLAFTLQVSGSMGTLPSTLIATAVPGSNGTQWAISLTGKADGVLASIANGEYSISINPQYVFAAADGTTPLANGRTDTFYRLFGDINGDQVVNAADNFQLKTALSTYNSAFDSNGDGVVNAADNFQFKASQSISFVGFTPTI